MKIVELIIDELDENSGIEAISIVESPAIEENFIALKEQKEFKFAEVDKDKRLLMGAILVPNKPIYRRDGEEEYYIYFTRDTVKKASELYLMRGNQNNATYEHFQKIEGLTLVESWIVEDREKDKTALYGMDYPLGTWAGSFKVNNDDIWNNYVKTGKVKGFSIEGYFADKAEKPKEIIEEDLSAEIDAAKKLLEVKKLFIEELAETYNDYPEGAVNNAKRALKWKKENGSSCGTSVGWKRASQLANKQNISRDTIARMASFKRHQQNKDVPYSEGCGGIMWDAWGGSAGVNWAISKLKEIDEKLSKSPCWDGYRQDGWKTGKTGKRVPNCVKIKRK